MSLMILFFIKGQGILCDYDVQVFERETHREKVLEGRRREMKLKAKQQSAAGGATGGGGWAILW